MLGLQAVGNSLENGLFMQDPTIVGKRVQQVLDKKYGANQRKMAKDLGVSQAAVSRVVNGQRMPSFALLQSLVLQTGVDANWLLTGKGTPFGDAAEEPRGLPLSKHFLPQLRQVRHELPRYAFPQLAALYRESRYIVEVQPDEPAVKIKAAKIKAGDLLVLESDPEYWSRDPGLLSQRDCVVSIPDGDAVSLALGRVVTEIVPGNALKEIQIEVYGGDTVTVQPSIFDAATGKYYLSIQLESGKQSRVTELVALVLLVWRP